MTLTANVIGGADGTAWLYSKWVQPPAQNRSERTFFRLLDAAEGLLSKRHWHEVSVQEIVKTAEASVGSFYNRFNDKTALLHCLDDRLGQECELTITQLIEELEGCPALIEDAASIVVSLLMRLCTERRGVIRALDLARKMAITSKQHAAPSPKAVEAKADGVEVDSNDTATGGFSDYGPRFDAALETFSAFLVAHDDALASHSVAVVVRAFRETFAIARENLLYEVERFDDVALHRALMRHFHASLQGRELL
ncbi:MAG: helix-turn-helix transcriptional regulator [Kordiimonadaceae bacterium]|nr:helix-turn-helix transcriptional regulator [Kordiimonadaceae bacterium]